MSIQWKDSLAIGVDEIDAQHKELIERVRGLFDACSQGKGRDEVGKVVKFLEDYVVSHFSAEEKLQQKYGYPEYTIHKKQHEQFIKDFMDFKVKLDEEGVNTRTVIHINRIVVDWLIKHISNTDKLLGAFLKTRMQNS